MWKKEIRKQKGILLQGFFLFFLIELHYVKLTWRARHVSPLMEPRAADSAWGCGVVNPANRNVPLEKEINKVCI